MQKILLSFLFFFLPWVSLVSAVTFGGSNNLSSPTINTLSGVNIGVKQFASGTWDCSWNSCAHYFRSMSQSLWNDIYRSSDVFIIDFKKSYFENGYTGWIMAFYWIWNGSESFNNASVSLAVARTSSAYDFYIVAYSQWFTQSFIQDRLVFSLPLNFSCGTNNPDTCAIAFKPVITVLNQTFTKGTWLSYVDVVVYNAWYNNTALFKRINFNNDTTVLTTWESVKNYIFWSDLVFWIQLSSNALMWIWEWWVNPPPHNPVNPFSYMQFYHRDPLNDESIYTDWLGGTSGSLYGTSKEFFWYNDLTSIDMISSGSGVTNGCTFTDLWCNLSNFSDSLTSWIPNFFWPGGWFEVHNFTNTSTGVLASYTGCTTINENFIYRDDTNLDSIYFISSKPFVQYFFDVINTFFSIGAIAKKSIVSTPQVCLFGTVYDVPQTPLFDVSASGSLFLESYNAKYWIVDWYVNTWSVQTFIDLLFIFIFTAWFLFSIRPLFIYQV